VRPQGRFKADNGAALVAATVTASVSETPSVMEPKLIAGA
jgi:hypothetical protein